MTELLEKYKDECEAIEDIALENEIPTSILEPLFESVLVADVKPIMMPTPKRRLRQNDSKETYEDPELSDHEVLEQPTHEEPSTRRKPERTKSRSPRRPKVSLKPKSETKAQKHVRAAFKLNTTIVDNYDRLSDSQRHGMNH